MGRKLANVKIVCATLRLPDDLSQINAVTFAVLPCTSSVKMGGHVHPYQVERDQYLVPVMPKWLEASLASLRGS